MLFFNFTHWREKNWFSVQLQHLSNPTIGSDDYNNNYCLKFESSLAIFSSQTVAVTVISIQLFLFSIVTVYSLGL